VLTTPSPNPGPGPLEWIRRGVGRRSRDDRTSLTETSPARRLTGVGGLHPYMNVLRIAGLHTVTLLAGSAMGLRPVPCRSRGLLELL
jgi:hypothetical protein